MLGFFFISVNSDCVELLVKKFFFPFIAMLKILLDKIFVYSLHKNPIYILKETIQFLFFKLENKHFIA